MELGRGLVHHALDDRRRSCCRRPRPCTCRPSRGCRRIRSAEPGRRARAGSAPPRRSRTGARARDPARRSLSMSAADRTGRANFGPSPASKSRPRFIACGMVRMSENRMAASSGYRSIGCRVTSQAMSGLVHIARKLPARARVARYSGRYRPAWRMSQTGLRGVGSTQQGSKQQIVLERGGHILAIAVMSRWSGVRSARRGRTGAGAPGWRNDPSFRRCNPPRPARGPPRPGPPPGAPRSSCAPPA